MLSADGEADIADLVTDVTLHTGRKNFESCLPEETPREVGGESMLPQEVVMDKAMERQLVVEL